MLSPQALLVEDVSGNEDALNAFDSNAANDDECVSAATSRREAIPVLSRVRRPMA